MGQHEAKIEKVRVEKTEYRAVCPVCGPLEIYTREDNGKLVIEHPALDEALSGILKNGFSTGITREIKDKPLDTYRCSSCGESWNFVPGDYDYNSELYPKKCPHCSMPIWEMLRDVYREEGIKGALRMLYLRLR